MQVTTIYHLNPLLPISFVHISSIYVLMVLSLKFKTPRRATRAKGEGKGFFRLKTLFGLNFPIYAACNNRHNTYIRSNYTYSRFFSF